ncbi:hypothetical protein AX16_010443 [Volvariella volvacea WC 439]|nr:hypothetical protein AX16_010443 [Volvariella volvacea WC 439]
MQSIAAIEQTKDSADLAGLVQAIKLGASASSLIESAALRPQLDSARLRHHDLGKEIQETEAKLESLKREQRNFSQQISLLKAALSATIRRVPVEIWREIFLSAASEPMGILPSRTEPRLSITHTCTFWRKMALDMPDLWRDYEINPTSHIYEGYTRPQCRSVMETVFPRAGGKLLSLTTSPHYTQHSTFPLYLIHDLLAPYGELFECLDVYLPSADLTFDGLRLASVRRLSIRLHGPRPFNGISGGYISFVEQTSALEHLSIILPWRIRELALPWNRLKSLDLQVECGNLTSPGALVHCFNQCQNLESLTFHVNSVISARLARSSPAPKISSMLHSLRYLDVISYSVDKALKFLGLLSYPSNLPMLTSLGLRVSNFNVLEDAPLLRSNGVDMHLAMLVVTSYYQGGPRFLRDHLAFPNLEELRVNLYRNSTLEQLTYLLEELREITTEHDAYYRSKGGDEATQPVGDQYIVAKPNPPLKRVTVAIPSYHLTVEYLNIVRELNSRGLRVDLATEPAEFPDEPEL